MSALYEREEEEKKKKGAGDSRAQAQAPFASTRRKRRRRKEMEEALARPRVQACPLASCFRSAACVSTVLVLPNIDRGLRYTGLTSILNLDLSSIHGFIKDAIFIHSEIYFQDPLI